jgi:chemotaxis-related protein WspB
MFLLLFEAGGQRYGLECAHVIEVLPRVRLQTVPDMPSWFAGLFAYRGRATPVIDLTQLITGQPCPPRWSTRIVMVRGEDASVSLFGLLTERASTAHLNIQQDAPGESAAYRTAWGPVLLTEEGMIQLLEIHSLLGAERGRLLAHDLTGRVTS